MSNYDHAEITAVHPPGTALAQYAGGQVEEYRARIVMAPDDAKALDDQLRACTLAVLREGVDYGVIPGTNGDKTLKKPGAEKLLQWFGLSFTCDRVEIDHDADGRREGVTYRCTVTKGLPDGRIITVTTCEGYAGYDEDKFYQTAEQAQFKAEAKERYWAAKDRRVANPNKWKYLTEYRAPWNTVIKMAQKRAIVGATIDATAAAGLFAQEEEVPPPRADDDGVVIADSQPADDPWDGYTTAPPRQDQPAPPPPDDGWPGVDQAIKDAASFKTEAEGQKLWREAGTAHRQGRCTRDEADHIQNLVNARVADRRKEACSRLLRLLSEDDPWRAKVEELSDGDDDGAREALGELGRLKAAGTVDETRAGRISRAIIARFPKAAVQDPEDGDA